LRSLFVWFLRLGTLVNRDIARWSVIGLQLLALASVPL
jgi:hypothetical protein